MKNLTLLCFALLCFGCTKTKTKTVTVTVNTLTSKPIQGKWRNIDNTNFYVTFSADTLHYDNITSYRYSIDADTIYRLNPSAWIPTLAYSINSGCDTLTLIDILNANHLEKYNRAN